MTTFVEAGLGNALVALILAVVALVAGLACRRPAVAHALWLLVLIKLVTPPLVSVSLPWPGSVPEVAEAPREAVSVEVVAAEIEEPFADRPEEARPAEALAPIEESPTPEIPYAGPPWQAVFGSVWLAGSLSWFAVAARRLWRFCRLLRHARPAPAELAGRVAALSRGLGLRTTPRTLLVPGHLSPMVWALGRVALLVPAKLASTMSVAALDTLLAHELAHIRRRDHWVRWLELAGLGLYWWNPVVWLARRELRQAEELCCDAWVVRCLPDARRVYATALVDALDFLSRPDEPVPALGCGLGRVDDLKWRLTMILRGQTSPRLGWTTTLGVFGLAVLLLPLVPGFSPAQPRAETPSSDVPAIRELDPESREKLKAEIDALIAKRVAEAQDKKAQAQLGYYKRVDELRLTKGQASRSQEYQALKAEVAAKTAALKQLEAGQSTRKGIDPQGITVVMSEDVRALQRELADYTEQMKALEMRLEKTPKQSDEFRKIQQELEARREKVEAIQRKLSAARDRFIQGGQLVTVRIEIHGVKVDMADMKGVAGIIKRIDWKELQDNKKDIKLFFARPADPASKTTPRESSGLQRITKPSLVTPPAVPQKGSSPDRRIEAVEKKLDAVLKELEAMKAKSSPNRRPRPDPAPKAVPAPLPPVPNDPLAPPGGAAPLRPEALPPVPGAAPAAP